MDKKCGNLVISLDFELFWGVLDAFTLDSFKRDMDGAREGIPMLLELFEKYGIHATWGAVGFLFAEDEDKLKGYIPEVLPKYKVNKSHYDYIESGSITDENSIYHFAPDLIEKILETPNQELASHTFSHYHGSDEGRCGESFEADIVAAKRIAKDKFGIVPHSLIFPRNQYDETSVRILKEQGFIAYRGRPKSSAYDGRALVRRMLRLIDTYIPICGKKYYDRSGCLKDGIANIKASVFLRKYSRRLRLLEPLKMKSIKSQMKKAAIKGKIFHIWWHPHNMGGNLTMFLRQTEEILMYYKELHEKYGFESMSMGELAKEIMEENA